MRRVALLDTGDGNFGKRRGNKLERLLLGLVEEVNRRGPVAARRSRAAVRVLVAFNTPRVRLRERKKD